MANETRRTKDGGQNRCRRCNRPLSNPNDNYGWWCAKLLGLDFYVEEDRKLDYDDLSVYTGDSDFMHIYWSAYATSKVGEDYARLFTHAHEFGWWEENKDQPEAIKMDLHNNQLGREIGKKTKTRDLEEAVLKSILEGKAAVLMDGKSMLYMP